MKKTLITIIIGLRGALGCIYGDSWIFETKGKAQEAFPEENIICSQIVDPSYDQTFKSVMSTDEDKVKYLMSFLNSIYYPEASENDLMIREIEALDKESTNLGKRNGAGITICDIACKCKAYSIGTENNRKRRADEMGESFNVEMQRSPEADFIMRLVEYGETLRHRHKIPIRGLGLLNYPVRLSHQDESKCYALCEIDPATNTPKRLIGNENVLEANTIDLRKFAPKKNEEKKEEDIYINGKKLGIIGVTWLKLFGIRQWNEAIEKKSIYKIFYPESIDANIKRVIDILSSIDQETLVEIEREQTLNKNVISSAKAEGIVEGARAKAIENARNFLKMGIPVDQVAKGTGLSEEEVQALTVD